MKKDDIPNITHTVVFLFLTASIVFVVYGFKNDLFSSQKELIVFMEQFGIWAPTAFVVFQAIQVVFPIIPGGISLLAGVFLFGPVMGFVYNYIGIVIGSSLAFLLAKRYGPPVIRTVFGHKVETKYMNWVTHPRFPFYFALAIFFPMAPDDLLCYLAGTTQMKFRFFLVTILLGKPLSIVAYSFGLKLALSHLTLIFH